MLLASGSATQSRSRVCSIATLVLLSAGSAAGAPISYLIGVDTTSVKTSSGFLDFQFNPGANTVQPAGAAISNFTTDGTLVFNAVADPTANPPVVVSPQVAGSVSGTLPGTLAFTNGSATNEVFQQFTFGTFFSFVLELTGPALNGPDPAATSGSTFSLALFDNPNMNPILTNQGSGVVVSVNVNLDASTTITAFPNGTAPSVVSFEEVPEPRSMFLLVLGTATLVLLRKTFR